MHDELGQRVLILLNSPKDAESSAKALSLSGVASATCGDVDEMCAQVGKGVGALLAGKDILNEANLAKLIEALAGGPAWSHVPLVLLLGTGEIVTSNDPALQRLEPLVNITLLEGPVRLSTLLSTLRASIAYRKRQYQQRDLLAQLEQSREEAIEANRAKSDFLANMSHEIRTPLGAVLGFSELLMESGVSEREKEIYMTTIRRNGQLLSALIDDILDLAKVESGRIDLEDMEFSLPELVSEVVSVLEPQASRKGLALMLDRGAGVPEMIRTDPIRFKQILMNLLGNAIKFTNQGAVQLRMVAQDHPNGRKLLEIEVEDSGIGIATAHQLRLFQPFTQADSSTTRRFGGTGLGLVLSRQLAQAMGGDVKLKWSVPGGGTCFGVELVVGIPDGGVAEAMDKCCSGSDGGPLSGKHILVVDDSLDNQLLIGRTLKLSGATVDLANDGFEAINKAMQQHYDAVLMDLQMPRLGGVDATRILREKGYKQPIVALTAHALKEDRVHCLKMGCTDYLTKPIQRAQLIQVLEKVSCSRNEFAPNAG